MGQEATVDVGCVYALVVADLLEGDPAEAASEQMDVRQPLTELEEAHAAAFVAAWLELLVAGVDLAGASNVITGGPSDGGAKV